MWRSFLAVLFIWGLVLPIASGEVLAQNNATGDPGFIEEKYLKLAGDGDKRAQFYLGLMHEAGVASNSSTKAAVDWYKKSASLNYLPAFYKLGLIYQTGVLGEPDMVIAAQYYREAAEQGFPEAQYNLGYLYETGQGTTRSEQTAASWYLKAATQGVPNAMRALGIFYHRGLGVEKDPVQAWVWMVRAVGAGDSRAAKLAAELGDLLNDEQRQQAKKLLDR